MTFKIAGRVVSHLGESLITDEIYALSELIKNAYDADANSIHINVDTSINKSGLIVIRDDGVGMNYQTILSGFLTLGTNIKQKELKISKKFNRISQGNKGIGRLSLHRLSNVVKVITCYEDTEDCYVFEIDWRNFDTSDDVSNVKIDIVESEEAYNEYFGSKLSKRHGTVLILSDVKNKMFWEESGSIRRIEGEIISLLNPYIDDDKKFSVHLNINDNIINSDSYSKDILHNNASIVSEFRFYTRVKEKYRFFYNDITRLVLSFKSNKTNLDMDNILIKQIFDIIEEYEPIDNDYFSKLRKKINHNNNQLFDILEDNVDSDDIQLKVLKLLDLDFRSVNIYDAFVNIKIQRTNKYYDDRVNELRKKALSSGFEVAEELLPTFEEIYAIRPELFNIDRDICISDFSREEMSYNYIHQGNEYLDDFYGVVYAFQYINKMPNQAQKYVSQSIGVQLFRNGFRVYPYGAGNDWLNFTRYSQTIRANTYMMHSTSGFVNIDGEENLKKIKELTNRQGILEDNHGANFLNLLKNVISYYLVRKDIEFRNLLMFSAKDVKECKYKGDIVNVADGIIQIRKLYDDSDVTIDRVEKIEIATKEAGFLTPDITKDISLVKSFILDSRSQIDAELEILDNKKTAIEGYYPYLATMIVTESLAHEIFRLSQRIEKIAKDTIVLLSRNDFSMLKLKIKSNMEKIILNVKYLGRSASLIDKRSYTKRRYREKFEIRKLINEIIEESVYQSLGNDSMISYSISQNTFWVQGFKENLVIAIENLIINSKYWLEKSSISPAIITIEIFQEKGVIRFFDNGTGIHKDIEDSLFEEFTTMKPPGEGRGLGLYLVRELLYEINAQISLTSNRNSYGNRYIFEIKFNNYGVEEYEI